MQAGIAAATNWLFTTVKGVTIVYLNRVNLMDVLDRLGYLSPELPLQLMACFLLSLSWCTRTSAQLRWRRDSKSILCGQRCPQHRRWRPWFENNGGHGPGCNCRRLLPMGSLSWSSWPSLITGTNNILPFLAYIEQHKARIVACSRHYQRPRRSLVWYCWREVASVMKARL